MEDRIAHTDDAKVETGTEVADSCRSIVLKLLLENVLAQKPCS